MIRGDRLSAHRLPAAHGMRPAQRRPKAQANSSSPLDFSFFAQHCLIFVSSHYACCMLLGAATAEEAARAGRGLPPGPRAGGQPQEGGGEDARPGAGEIVFLTRQACLGHTKPARRVTAAPRTRVAGSAFVFVCVASVLPSLSSRPDGSGRAPLDVRAIYVHGSMLPRIACESLVGREAGFRRAARGEGGAYRNTSDKDAVANSLFIVNLPTLPFLSPPPPRFLPQRHNINGRWCG